MRTSLRGACLESRFAWRLPHQSQTPDSSSRTGTLEVRGGCATLLVLSYSTPDSVSATVALAGWALRAPDRTHCPSGRLETRGQVGADRVSAAPSSRRIKYPRSASRRTLRPPSLSQGMCICRVCWPADTQTRVPSHRKARSQADQRCKPSQRWRGQMEHCQEGFNVSEDAKE